MKISEEQENEYLQAYFEVFAGTEEYAAMSKKEIQNHLETILQEYRILMANMAGRIETAKQFGIGYARLERLVIGPTTRQ
jgi:DNA polymerase I-like protein with 3'-5' exonuclease and polymerase domains